MKDYQPVIIHYVYNMKRAIQFYTVVFDVELQFESTGWSTINFGSFELALHILTPGHDQEGPIPHAGLNLLVDNIENMSSVIDENGGRLVELREPDSFVPVRVATCVDSEGNGFEIRQLPEAWSEPEITV